MLDRRKKHSYVSYEDGASPASTRGSTANSKQINILTDAGFDVDDVGAVCLANALADNGEAEIVAVGHTNGYNKGIGSVSTLMHFYGRDAVPLGAYKGAWAKNPRAPGAKGVADKYIPDLVNGFPSPVKDYSTVPTAVQAYRQVLAAQPDHSVHIAAIGITTNMRDLVQSQPELAASMHTSLLAFFQKHQSRAEAVRALVPAVDLRGGPNPPTEPDRSDLYDLL